MNASKLMPIHYFCIINLKKENLPQLLMPWKFSSQSCEGLFRLLRSASSTSSTQTNFSVRNFAVDKGRKVDVRLRATAENMNDGVLYPRNRKTFDEDIAAPDDSALNCKKNFRHRLFTDSAPSFYRFGTNQPGVNF